MTHYPCGANGSSSAPEPFPANTERLPGDVYIDGGWQDDAGFPLIETTAPLCDRTCLSCQGGDHVACGLGCHDEQDTN